MSGQCKKTVDRTLIQWDKHCMTSSLQFDSHSIDATRQVRAADSCAAVNINISLLLSLSIIPTPSGVCLIV